MKSKIIGVVVALFATVSMSLLPASQVSAAGWTYLSVPDPSVVTWARACKVWMNGGFGPVYQVHFHLLRSSSVVNSIRIVANRPVGNGYWQTVSIVTNNQWINGEVSGVSTYASIVLGDTVNFDAWRTNGTGWAFGGSFINPATLQTCP